MLFNSVRKWPGYLDIYPNIKWINKVQAPVLVMHVSAGGMSEIGSTM